MCLVHYMYVVLMLQTLGDILYQYQISAHLSKQLLPMVIKSTLAVMHPGQSHFLWMFLNQYLAMSKVGVDVFLAHLYTVAMLGPQAEF